MPPDVPTQVLPCLRPRAFLFSYPIYFITRTCRIRRSSRQLCRLRHRRQIDFSDLLSLQISFAPGNYKYTWNFQHTRNFQHTPALSWSNFLHARKSFRDEGQTVLDEGQTSWHVFRYLQVYPGTYRYLPEFSWFFRERSWIFHEPSSVRELNSLATIKLVAPTS